MDLISFILLTCDTLKRSFEYYHYVLMNTVNMDWYKQFTSIVMSLSITEENDIFHVATSTG